MKKKLLSGALAAVLMVVIGMSTTGRAEEREQRLWSIAVHLAYVNGNCYSIPE